MCYQQSNTVQSTNAFSGHPLSISSVSLKVKVLRDRLDIDPAKSIDFKRYPGSPKVNRSAIRFHFRSTLPRPIHRSVESYSLLLQYLDDMILEREKANDRLREELNQYVGWCQMLDQNQVELLLLKRPCLNELQKE